MLPGSLYSSYEQYKIDSDFVANWLATTATACGYIDAENSSTNAPKAPRLKGKARKHARQVNKNTWHQNTYRVRIRDFVPLAQCIANNLTRRVEVPAKLAYRLQRGIRQRRYHHQWHSRQCEGAEGNKGHGYFIGILEHVEEILRPNFAASVKSEPGTSDIDDCVESAFTNRFERLTVEEAIESSESSTVPGVSSSVNHAQFTTDLGTSKEEAMLAMDCLFKDLHEMRHLIRSHWESYRRGEMDLVAVSITTNTAIDFARSLQEDFDAIFANMSCDVLKKNVCTHCVIERVSGNLSTVENFPVDTCLEDAYNILSCFVGGLQGGTYDSVYPLQPTSMEIYESPADWSTVSPDERFRQQCQIFIAVLPEFQVLIAFSAKTGATIQAQHELLRGLREVMEQRKASLWVAFALQVFLDIRHVLREDAILAFADLRHKVKNIINDIDRTLEFNAGLKNRDEDDRLNHILHTVRDLANRFAYEDNVGVVRRHCLGPDAAPVPEFFLLKRDPLWCGLLLYHFRTAAYQSGLMLANTWSSILATAHLYNCLQQQDPLTRQWTDMDSVFSSQGAETLLIGRPKSLVQCTKHFWLAFGTSCVAFAPNRRDEKIEIRSDRSRKLDIRTPISQIFKHRYCEDSGRVNFEPSDVEAILRQSSKDKIPSRSRPKVDICHLLSSLAQALDEETEELTFDYSELVIVCFNLLRRLRDAVGSKIRAWTSYPHDESHLTSFVGFLLINVQDMDVWHDEQTGENVLDKARVVLNEFLATDAGRVTMKRDRLLEESVKMRRQRLDAN